MKEKTCCFTGHRDIPSGAYQLIFKKTEEMVESLIQKGYLYFGAGGALGFDTIASFTVLKLKERYPNVRSIRPPSVNLIIMGGPHIKTVLLRSGFSSLTKLGTKPT